jgi:hydrogenase maturation factor
VAQQLGGALESGGLGRQVAQDLFGETGDVGAREAVRVGVDTLTDAFTLVTSFLPDVNVYGVTSQVERGLILGWPAMGQAALVTVGFALPLLSLGYLVLRRKEVAP